MLSAAFGITNLSALVRQVTSAIRLSDVLTIKTIVLEILAEETRSALILLEHLSAGKPLTL
jgi:hypothetical protein